MKKTHCRRSENGELDRLPPSRRSLSLSLSQRRLCIIYGALSCLCTFGGEEGAFVNGDAQTGWQTLALALRGAERLCVHAGLCERRSLGEASSESAERVV